MVFFFLHVLRHVMQVLNIMEDACRTCYPGSLGYRYLGIVARGDMASRNKYL